MTSTGGVKEETSYSMEMQLVFFDGYFSSYLDAEASDDTDAVAVISYFLEVDDDDDGDEDYDNVNLNNIVDALGNIEYGASFEADGSWDESEDLNPFSDSQSVFIVGNVQEEVWLNLYNLTGSWGVDDYFYYDVRLC